jgi:hypothetical protein
MKLLKFVTFVSILGSSFIIVYRNSDNKGLRRLRISFRTAVIAASLASLSSKGPEATEFYVSNSQVVHERLVSNQEFNWLEENDRQVIMVKTDGNPITPPTRGSGPSNLPTRGAWINPSPFPRRSGTGINPYRTTPKLVNQGLGPGGNPAAPAGNDEFNDKSPVPKKEQSKTSDYDYRFNSQKKKKQSAEQCELDQNVEVKKIDIVYRIKESPGLYREAQKTMKNQEALRDINHLIKQLSLNNKNPGKRNRKIDSLKTVTEARGTNGGRVYFREKDGTIEVLAVSGKGNQKKVIALLQEIGY